MSIADCGLTPYHLDVCVTTFEASYYYILQRKNLHCPNMNRDPRLELSCRAQYGTGLANGSGYQYCHPLNPDACHTKPFHTQTVVISSAQRASTSSIPSILPAPLDRLEFRLTATSPFKMRTITNTRPDALPDQIVHISLYSSRTGQTLAQPHPLCIVVNVPSCPNSLLALVLVVMVGEVVL